MFFIKTGVFLGKKSPRQGCTTQKSGLGMQQQIGYHNPNIQISSLKVPVGWLTGSWQILEIPSTMIYGWRAVLAPSVNHHYSWVCQMGGPNLSRDSTRVFFKLESANGFLPNWYIQNPQRLGQSPKIRSILKKNHSTIKKNMFFMKRDIFLRKKAPGRAAPHRRPSWGWPPPPFPIKTNQRIKSSGFGGRRQRRQPANYVDTRGNNRPDTQA